MHSASVVFRISFIIKNHTKGRYTESLKIIENQEKLRKTKNYQEKQIITKKNQEKLRKPEERKN